MDSLTSITTNSVKISKIHKTESSVPLKPEVDLDFRGHLNMPSSVRIVNSGFLDFKDISRVEIVKIHKTVLML